MKNFERITGNVEILADAMTREAKSAMRIAVEGVAEELLKCDFSDDQKTLIRSLVNYFNNRNNMRSVRLLESYVKWMNEEIVVPSDRAEDASLVRAKGNPAESDIHALETV